VREVQEEAGLTLPDPDALVPFARWITPAEVSVRFDTWFFLARAPAGQEAEPDGQEIVDARWFAPARALEGGEAGDLLLVFPTIKNLERLARFDSADALLEWAAQHEVKPVQPRVEGQGEAARIVLDDDDDV
jgi:8-oxo-dGTP pyrophosphatase MutT (NUDIX family)